MTTRNALVQYGQNGKKDVSHHITEDFTLSQGEYTHLSFYSGPAANAEISISKSRFGGVVFNGVGRIGTFDARETKITDKLLLHYTTMENMRLTDLVAALVHFSHFGSKDNLCEVEIGLGVEEVRIENSYFDGLCLGLRYHVDHFPTNTRGVDVRFSGVNESPTELELLEVEKFTMETRSSVYTKDLKIGDVSNWVLHEGSKIFYHKETGLDRVPNMLREHFVQVNRHWGMR